MEFSDDGSWLVSGDDDGQVLLWPTNKALDDLWTPIPTEMDTEHDDGILCLAVSPNNDQIFSCGYVKKLLINDVKT